ncbi:hypothetical protein ILUMI_22414 [Ignelater luminosus]|uniref:Uncharacterized protein n=1 Tax=Ignelater luminosus TaxID=2038154 RepID=A0A8K0CH58_IGNLU|nr:hypothetical protein ILUMI_22414 [Ignelater luminosus]
MLFSSSGGCTFPEAWSGRWFQSGIPNPVLINRTHIETKGECYEQGDDTKYLVYDRSDGCYRCMAIHNKHTTVLQYKETFCEGSPNDLCFGITGDAPLYSMFRKSPEAKPVPCPFKSAPFTFSYNKGSGDCNNPPSKAESCTDDSRLVLKYQACPDVPSAESNVEELMCMATWKEGSTRYLLGKISQVNRRALTSDEDQYRCFIYQRRDEGGKNIYYIAQSGDATCNGIQNALEGSRTMKFITVDNHHNRCKFPVWITDHHTWLSLDHKKMYKFSQRNATLKIVDEEPKPNRFHQNYAQPFDFQQNGFESQDQRRQNSEMRVVCHNILQSQEQKKVQIVAHITAGCDSGYVCMMFYKRDSNVIELQQSERYEENPDDACRYFDPTVTPYTTLITPTLHPKKCPHRGRFTVISSTAANSRKRRQQPGLDNNSGQSLSNCQQHDYEGLAIGCNGEQALMEFRSSCSQQSFNTYNCLGSWQENNTYYVVTSPISRKSSDVLRYCFIYNINGPPQTASSIIEGALGRNTRPAMLRLSSVSESCHRDTTPGVSGTWAFNFTSIGTCAEVGNTDVSSVILPSVFLIVLTTFLGSVLR